MAIRGLLCIFELRPIDLHVLWFLAPIHRLFSLIEGIPTAAEGGGIVAAGFSPLVEMQMEHLIAGREHEGKEDERTRFDWKHQKIENPSPLTQ